MLNWLLAKELPKLPHWARDPFIFATIHIAENLCLTKNDPKPGVEKVGIGQGLCSSPTSLAIPKKPSHCGNPEIFGYITAFCEFGWWW